MSDRKVVVPEGMLEAADRAISKARGFGRDLTGAEIRGFALEAALRWLAENPIVPTEEDIRRIVAPKFGIPLPEDLSGNMAKAGVYAAIEWQRRMFLAPEPEVPNDVRILLRNPGEDDLSPEAAERINRAIIEAYRRGRNSR